MREDGPAGPRRHADALHAGPSLQKDFPGDGRSLPGDGLLRGTCFLAIMPAEVILRKVVPQKSTLEGHVYLNAKGGHCILSPARQMNYAVRKDG